MGIRTDTLNRSFRVFIQRQFLFFVATAAPEGRVNLSPKALDTLRIVSDRRIVWLNVTGSGNETAAHVRQSPRMTLMFCAFEGDALTLRVYGRARLIHPHDDAWAEHCALFPDYAGARNIFVLDIELVTTSCGTSIPEMTVVRARAETDLEPWYRDMGPDGVEAFWRKKNAISLDGAPTGLLPDGGD